MNKNKQAGYRLCTLMEEQDISAAASGEDDKKLLESASDAENIIRAVEEMVELTQALSKWYRYKDQRAELMPHLIEEMADVIISVDLMKELCGIADEDVQKEIESKMQKDIEGAEQDG